MGLTSDEVKRLLLAISIVLAPVMLGTILLCTILLYTPKTITGTVQIVKNEHAGESIQIILRGEGDNILGNKDYVIWKNFDAADEVIFEKENITDGDEVVFNHKGVIQYKITK